MKAFKQIKILPYGMLFFSMALTLCCSGNPMASSSPEAIEAGIKNGEYVKLSRSASNQITRGRDVFEVVMRKYQPVIDFYGADSEVFRKMVNTNLMMNAESLTSPSEKMFNYDSMALWDDTEIVVEYGDGTKEALPADELLTIDGAKNPDWYRHGKKITNYMVKFKKADEILKKFVSKTADLSKDLKSFKTISEDFEDLSNLIKNCDELTAICDTLVKIGNWAGYAGIAFNLAAMTGIIETGPSIDETVKMKLDYIIDLIQGISTHLEFIEQRLYQVQHEITAKTNQQVSLQLKSVQNDLDGILDEFSTAPSLTLKMTLAKTFLEGINGKISDYINWSMAEYNNYSSYQQNQDDAEFSPISIQIDTPFNRQFTENIVFGSLSTTGDVTNKKINCRLSVFKMINPVSLLPISYEGLEYLKWIINSRFRMNSFYNDEETDMRNQDQLDSWNSDIALLYINDDTNYIGRLRNTLVQRYIIIAEELGKINAHINSNNGSVKDNWTTFSQLTNPSLVQSSMEDSQAAAYHGTADAWDYITWYSSDPVFNIHLVVTNGSYYEVCHTYPYYPSITIGTNTPFEFIKPVSDAAFLDDANVIIQAYYKARTNKLLEFAASLAALEVQLAMYLDDGDYAVYAQ